MIERPEISWRAEAGVDVDCIRLADAITAALTELSYVGPWTYGDMSRALEGLKIRIVDTDRFHDRRGRTIEGERYSDDLRNKIITIGPTYATLVHELAHVCEQMMDGWMDFNHTHWAARGINAANVKYQAWRIPKPAVV